MWHKATSLFLIPPIKANPFPQVGMAGIFFTNFLILPLSNTPYIWPMATSKNKFTLKIILGYLVLGTLAVVVGWFLFSEIKNYSRQAEQNSGEKKFIETGTLINLVYKTDGFSRLALLTESDSDFDNYMAKNDSLFDKIEEIKNLTTNQFQRRQLDSVKALLEEKNRNIEQLRILRLTNQKETTLDDIMKEVGKLEASVGLNSVEGMVRDPSKLSARERRIWQSYADYLNSDAKRDTSMIKTKKVDSMLIASRYIVSEAKKENSRIRKSLMQKENELILNDLNISERLREIIASFDAEITRNNTLDAERRATSIGRTEEILKFAAFLGGVVILLFSYFILSDFFRAERFKQNLEESKSYAENLLKSREQLISTVSHDLKTPLNTISGYSELFKNSPLSEKQHHYLSQINSSSQFISHLVDDLLDYSKLEAGRLSVEEIPFSLENIIKEAANAVKQSHSHKEVALEIDIAPSIKGVIYKSDPLRIRQILNNLLGNAFKFTEKGYVKVSVALLKSEDPIDTIAISVKDTGIGISQQNQELIFKEFTQAEADIAHRFGGSGLGLAISKKLAALLNGSLAVESALGKGSCFTLTLPLKRSETNRDIAPVAAPAMGKNHFGIVIDDDPAMRAMLTEIFAQMEIETQSFGQFEDLVGWETDCSQSVDFILTDIQMPGVNGFEVLHRLQQNRWACYRGQPVIAMTGSREHSNSYFLQKGFSGILRKPFTPTQLRQTIDRLLGLATAPEPQFSTETTDKNEIFNLNSLQSFLSTPQALEEVLQVFYSQTETDMEALKKAILHQDISLVGETSHRMLTMNRQLQATAVVRILEKMEDYSPEKVQLSEMEKDFVELKSEMQTLLHALRKRKRTIPKEEI